MEAPFTEANKALEVMELTFSCSPRENRQIQSIRNITDI